MKYELGLAARNIAARELDDKIENAGGQVNNDSKDSAPEDGCPQIFWPSPSNPCSDVANAMRLIKAYRDDLRFVNYVGWYYWDGSIWKKDPHNAIRFGQSLGTLITSEPRELSISRDLEKWAKRSEQKPQIESALKLAKPYLAVEPDSMDQAPHLLCVANGTIDLRTGFHREYQREDFITQKINIDYNLTEECPVWKATISRVLGHDQSLIDYFQRVCGYCLTGSTREQALFMLLGPGANGKSTVVMTLQSIFGPYARQAAPNLLMASNFDRHPTELADLKGARLAVVSETPDGGRLNENLVKHLTGGDLIKARFMRQDFFEFKPTHKFMIMSNHKPIVAGDDLAIWRRIHLVPFDVVIPKDEQDKALPNKLLSETAGILRWCVEGCQEWLRQGLNPPAAVTAATEAYKQQQDIFSQFLDECCSLGQYKQVTAAAVFNAYKAWCIQTGQDAKSQVVFWESLSRHGITKKRTSMGFLYHGISLERVE